MNSTCEQLAAWGCDVQGALSRFINDEELYLHCLKTFASDENFALLEASLRAGDVAEAFDHAHTLKGVTANLGLTPLYHALIAIVEILRKGELTNLEQSTTRLNAELAHYQTLIQG